MSKADFTVQQAAIAPAVAELDKPEIKAGQVWRCRDGELREVSRWRNGDLAYRWAANDGKTLTKSGREYGIGVDGGADLIELIKDENGFTIWRGGEQPKETRGKRVDWIPRGEVSEPIDTADDLDWDHDDSDGDILAYKVIEAAKGPLDGAAINSAMIADAAITTETVEERRRELLGVDPGEPGGDRHVVSVEIPPGYDKLFDVLMQAFEQAAGGKGKERHARDGVAFEDQPMSQINKQLGSIDGFIYQAHKKSLEAKRLPDGRAQAELLGSINYIAGAVIAIDTWAKKDSDAD